MEALLQRDEAGGGEGGMGAVVVHDPLALHVEDGAVVARDGEVPQGVLGDVQISLEDVAEVVLVRGVLDGRGGHLAAGHDRRGRHVRRAGELAPVIGVAAAGLEAGELPGLAPDGRERMDPEQGTRCEPFLERTGQKDAILVDGERAFIQGGRLRRFAAVQGVANGRAFGPAAQLGLESTVEVARIAF